ncbi:MAG: hypothetical protein Kow0020_14560 [Wenzhouxiangellaceae bacterium]
MSLPRLLASRALGYFRWTQLTPMIAAWTFYALMIGALLITNLQDQSLPVLERTWVVLEELFGPFDEQDFGETDADGALHFTEDDILPAVLRAWGLLSLVLWLLGMLVGAVFGYPPRATLSRKLAVAAVAALVGVALCLCAWSFGSETFHGSAMGWIALFLGSGLLVWLISAWSLTIGTLVDRLQLALDDSREPSPGDQRH